MRKLTRREFGRNLSRGAIVSLVASAQAQNVTPARQEIMRIPDMIGGYRLSQDDKVQAAKFLANHENTMTSVRKIRLANDLAPATVFVSPIMKKE
jgi:hypothetical protein